MGITGNGHNPKKNTWERVRFPDPKNREYDTRQQPPHALRARLRRLGFSPRKKLGQNFLADEEILARIADAAEVEASDEVLEVGPGLGTLTDVLTARAGHVTAVELDGELAAIVRAELAGRSNLEVVNQDILKFDLAARFRPRGYKMVGNLPYYVTSPILRFFLESDCSPSLMVMMLQKEVADRLLARPGDMSLLTVSVLLYGEPHLVRYVEAHAFYPAPKVDSAIVRIDVRPRPVVDVEPELFFTLAAAGFSQRRKQLHNALSQRFWMHPGQASELLREAGIDPTRRAETLSMEDWAALYRVFLRACILKSQPAPPGEGREP